MKELVEKADFGLQEARQDIVQQRKQKRLINFQFDNKLEQTDNQDAFFNEKLQSKKEYQERVKEELQKVIQDYTEMKDFMNRAKEENTKCIKKIKELDWEFEEKNEAKHETHILVESLDFFDKLAKVFIYNDPAQFFNENFELRAKTSSEESSSEDELGAGNENSKKKKGVIGSLFRRQSKKV